jgi:hypothetical protein
VIERVQCPSCSAPYGLKPHRVRREHRRALCFKCGGIFPIAEAVDRLLGTAPPPPAFTAAPFPVPAGATGFEDAAPSPAAQAAAAIAAPWDLEQPPPPPLPDSELSTLGIPASHISAVQQAAEEILSDETPPTLSLDDLEGAEEEILEKTLHGVSLPPLEEAAPPAPVLPPVPEMAPDIQEPLASGEAGYSSAADAISRLLGGVAAREPNKPRPLSTSMDLEATLNALESSLKGPVEGDGPTLGGVHPGLPPLPPAYAAPEPELGTVKLSGAELLAAMSSATGAAPEPVVPEPMERTLMLPAMAPPPKASMVPPSMAIEASEQTMMMVPPPLVAPMPAPPPSTNIAVPPITAQSPAATVTYPSPTLQLPTPSASASGDYDPNLLKVQMGQEVLSNLSMDQVVRMVQAGEIQEYHLVARQFSENWLEASKVPALRPVFERLRRAKPAEPLPPPPALGETAPVKKSLFGGLFGKKE